MLSQLLPSTYPQWSSQTQFPRSLRIQLKYQEIRQCQIYGHSLFSMIALTKWRRKFHLTKNRILHLMKPQSPLMSLRTFKFVRQRSVANVKSLTKSLMILLSLWEQARISALDLLRSRNMYLIQKNIKSSALSIQSQREEFKFWNATTVVAQSTSASGTTSSIISESTQTKDLTSARFVTLHLLKEPT